MSNTEIITIYLAIQATIDHLWEFFVLSHLAIVGWLLSVDDKHIERARFVLCVFYSFLLAGLLFFFFEAYSELEMIHHDLTNSIKNFRHTEKGYFIYLIDGVDVSKRMFRTGIIFSISWLSMMFLLFFAVRKVISERNRKSIEI